VKEAGALWIKRCRDKSLETMTIKGYEEHCELHIYPFIGAKKLSDLTVPAVNAFADQLREAGRSAEMIKRVVRSLGAIFKEARRRGLSNVAPTVGIELERTARQGPLRAINHCANCPKRAGASLQVLECGCRARGFC
jgi:integrase